MDETLGKRIVSHRKQLGITQDRLAEQLGVTAQAVSKWENDLSCPDITMLPKLAEIFGISVDALLGLVPSDMPKEPEPEQIPRVPASAHKHHWELQWDPSRKQGIGLALWIIVTAGWLFAASWLQLNVSLWDLLWTNGLLVFGLFGLFPKFSFFRMGCALLGTYFLLDKLTFLPAYLGRDLLLPAFLLLFGLSLLMDALFKPHKPFFSLMHNGRSITNTVSSCTQTEDTFAVDCAFGEKTYMIEHPNLRQGDADVSFGHMTLDLTRVETFAPNCAIDADCSFGELTILIPKQIRAEIISDSSFGSIDVVGNCNPDALGLISINADVSFGHITVQYI